MDLNTIMAVNNKGEEITVALVRNWINDPANNKKNLSEFIYDRLYGRYIRPFEFSNDTYKKFYKNGFTIMANCCLLIETFASFRRLEFKDTKRKSEKCFGWFFNAENRFVEFARGGLSVADYLSDKPINNRGVPLDFYRNVRCGILHNGETRNGWKIVRKGSFYNDTAKIINATKFMKKLKATLKNYRNQLDKNNIQTTIWNNCIERVKFLIDMT